MDDEKKFDAPIKAIPIKWDHSTKDIVTRYATNMTIQHTDNEFFITFYEIRPPFLIGNEEQVRAQADNIDYIEAECVARLAISAGKMPKIIKAMQENYEKFRIASQKGNEMEQC